MSELSVINAMAYANTNAGGFVTLAKAALSASQIAVNNVGFGNVVWRPISPPLPPTRELIPATPQITTPILSLPPDPGAAPVPVFPLTINAGAVPQNKARAPVLSFPSAPSSLDSAPRAPVINTSFVFPEPPAALSAALPAAPVFTNRTEPTAPEIILPLFEQSLPERMADAPTNGAEIMGTAYALQSLNSQKNADAYVDAWITKHSPKHHQQMALIESRLEAFLAGGTGLQPAVEDAIYSRARERNDVEAARLRDAAYRDAANRGFTLPSGALMAGIARARQDAANNNLKANSDIVVLQAEIEQKNLQFAVTAAIGLRTAMVSAASSYMGHVVSINGQAMDYAKSAFANVVELYNASVRVYAARIDAYKSYAAVYETQMKAVTIKLDIFRGEIAALEAMTNVDQSRVAIYKSQIDAVASLIGLYRAQIESVQGRASLEKLKLDIFQAQTQSFGAQVQAKNAEWSGYSAKLSGEEIKMKIYAQELNAFNSEVEAYRSVIGAKAADVTAITATNQANASIYSASVQGFSAKVSAESERSRAHNENNKMVMTEFNREISAFMARTNLSLAQYKAENDAKVQNATGDLNGQVESVRAKTQYGATLAQLSNDGAKIYGQLAGAAMAGINTLAADVNGG